MKNLPTNKNFGLVFSAFFLFIYFYIFLAKDLNLLILLFISVIFLILGVLNSIILKPLNILSIIISPLILAFVFYIIVTPIGFIKRLFTKNYLDINYDRNKKSYWISCKKKPFYFKKQY
jgi:hypothetical protein